MSNWILWTTVSCMIIALTACGPASEPPGPDAGSVADSGLLGDASPVDAAIDAGEDAGTMIDPLEVAVIRAGNTHTCVSRVNGTVLCWGYNEFGLLGFETSGDRTATPTLLEGIDSAVDIATGTYFSCALLEDSTVMCFGRNASGTLGPAATIDPSPPVLITGLADVVEVSLGDLHACARTPDGRVLCWGSSASGAMWDATNMGTATPTPLPGVDDAEQVVCRDVGTCVRHAGRIDCAGEMYAIFNLPSGTDVPAPRAIAGFPADVVDFDFGSHMCAVTSGGNVWCLGANTAGQTGVSASDYEPAHEVAGLRDITKVAVTNDSTCALDVAGDVFCWGGNDFGQLGNEGRPASRTARVSLPGPAADVTANGRHVCVLLRDAEAYCWGWNTYYQTGSGRDSIVDRPRRVRF